MGGDAAATLIVSVKLGNRFLSRTSRGTNLKLLGVDTGRFFMKAILQCSGLNHHRCTLGYYR